MTKFRFQTILQYEYDSETNRTRMIKSFTKPIGTTAENRQRGKTKMDFKGAIKDDDEVVL